MTQSTKTPRRIRVTAEHFEKVSTMLTAMMPNSQIEKQCALEWVKTRTYVRKVIAAVHQSWAESAALIQDTRRHQLREAGQFLYVQALSNKERSVALHALEYLAKLDGVAAPSKVDVTHNGQVGVGISLGNLGYKSSQDVMSRIDELRAKLAKQGPSALQSTTPQAIQANLNALPAPDAAALDREDE